MDAPALIQDASQSLVSLEGITDPDDVFNEVAVFGYALEKVA